VRLLLVEDDPTLRAQLRSGLEDAGYVVDEADNGRDAHFQGDTEPYDAVVLDLGLPLLDGLTVLKRWRDAGRSTPVLILTARDNWSEKVAGIDAGADDYLTKPFHMEELLARVRGLIRRAAGQASPVLRCGDLALDTRSGRVTLGGQTVTLTSPRCALRSRSIVVRDCPMPPPIESGIWSFRIAWWYGSLRKSSWPESWKRAHLGWRRSSGRDCC